jgi:AcrR family transcriptional regulator
MKKAKSVGRPRGSARGVTRARILAAARVAFAKGGYGATTNKDIADLAGITTAAIYQYFDSKTALYMDTVRDANQALLPAYRSVVEGARSTRDALRALLLASAELHHRDPSLAAFLSALPVEMQRHPELAAAMADSPSEIVDVFEKAVEIGVKSGEIPRAQAPLVVALFVACSMGLSLFVAAVVGSSLHDIVETFLAVIDGKLFRGRRRR